MLYQKILNKGHLFCLAFLFANFISSAVSSTLKVGIKDLPHSMDPALIRFAHHYLVFQSSYQTLFRIDSLGELSPSIAKKWKISSDMKEIEIKLDNIWFHNGKKITANDVKFSLSRLFWKSSAAPNVKMFSKYFTKGQVEDGTLLDNIKILDPLTLKITLFESYRPILLAMTTASFSIFSKDEFIKNGSFIGSGPYMVQAKGTDELIFKANHKSSPIKPIHQTLVFKTFKDITSAVKSIPKNELDLVFAGVNSANTMPASVKLESLNNPAFLHIFTNKKSRLLSDKKRRALVQYILNEFKSAEENSVLPLAKPIKTLAPPGFIPSIKFDSPELTNVNLWLCKDKKRKCSLSLLSTDNIFKADFYEKLKKSFFKYGIELKVDLLPIKKYIKHAVKTEKYDLVFGGYAANFPDIDGILYPIIGFNGWTYGNYNYRKCKKEIAKFRSEPNREKRLNSYVSAINDFSKELNIFPMYQAFFQVYYSQSLSKPQSNYRYEGEIWNLKWKEEKKSQ